MTPEQEVQELRALLAARDREIEARNREIEELRIRLQAAEDGALRLQRDLEKLRRELHGAKSERLDPNRLPIPEPEEKSVPEDQAGATQASDTAPTAPKAGQADPKGKRGPYQWKDRKKNVRRDVSEMNDLETVCFRAEVTDRNCPCGCGAQAVTIGYEESWRLERIPARIVRHQILQEKVAWPAHRGGPSVGVRTAESSASYALPKALCGNRLLAEVGADKYADHLPAYRQSERFAREGIELSRSTLVDWLMAFANLLKPIRGWLADQVRGGGWLRADATGMPVLDPPTVKGKAHHGHLWAWGNWDSVIFEYTDNKRGETVAALFRDFKGVLLIDGATDFNLLEKAEGVTRAGCWAHARRKLYEALPYDPKKALAGLVAIRRLFMVERVVMAAPLEERVALRKDLCRPILDGIRVWVDEELPQAVPKQPLHGALQYLKNQWSRLEVFLEKGVLECHNNATERDLRRPVKGRDNYLFAGSPAGAEAAAVYYTLVGTCLLQGIDPRRYLEEVAGRLDEPVSRLTPQAIREEWEAGTGKT